eukprot:jgi/Chlat1/8884/Chrsp92S08198
MRAGVVLRSVVDGENSLREWWERVEKDPEWQERSLQGLAAAYALIALVALVQLVRIQVRIPEYGWTTQKVFHLLNLLFCAMRSAVCFFREDIQKIHPPVLVEVLLDLPGLLFFTTYTLLVLFWAEIYHQARNLPTSNLRPAFVICNISVYSFQFAIWIYMSLIDPSLQHLSRIISKCFFAGISFAGAGSFLIYGGRLFFMLRRFPIESKGRRKKLQEVGAVTAICATGFTIRAIMIAYSAMNNSASVDKISHPLLNLLYYTLAELIPSVLVLYILRKLPPKRMGQYKVIQ